MAEEANFERKKKKKRSAGEIRGNKKAVGRTGACAGGYKNRGAISRTTTFTSGHREGPRFTTVFGSLRPAGAGMKRSSRRIADERERERERRRKRKKKKKEEGERERLGSMAIEWLCQINNDLWGRCTPIHHSINIALFDRQITHRPSRFRAGFDTFYLR